MLGYSHSFRVPCTTRAQWVCSAAENSAIQVSCHCEGLGAHFEIRLSTSVHTKLQQQQQQQQQQTLLKVEEEEGN